jgi:hypothetical protein
LLTKDEARRIAANISQAAGAAAQLAICSLFIEIGGGLHLAFPMGGGRTFVDAKAKL